MNVACEYADYLDTSSRVIGSKKEHVCSTWVGWGWNKRACQWRRAVMASCRVWRIWRRGGLLFRCCWVSIHFRKGEQGVQRRLFDRCVTDKTIKDKLVTDTIIRSEQPRLHRVTPVCRHSRLCFICGRLERKSCFPGFKGFTCSHTQHLFNPSYISDSFCRSGRVQM